MNRTNNLFLLIIIATSIFMGSCKKETCEDGIQNQSETGIDCGGECDPCPTCSDGIQNQAELGVDCGGPCSTSCTGPNSTTSEFYIMAEIDGQLVKFEDGIDGYANGAGVTTGGTDTAGYQEEQYSTMTKTLASGQQATISILKTFPSEPSNSEREGMFYVGTYAYGKAAFNNGGAGINGAKFHYLDANNVEWTTDQGTADQSNSTFEITEHIQNTDGWSEKISKGEFSCTLYDGNGNSKSVTDGYFRGRTVQYQ